jgi:osmotically-inducible protein OsmY
MKSPYICALFVAALSTGAAFAQLPAVQPLAAPPLPEVQPQPAPKSTVAQSVDDSAITSKVTAAISSDPALKGLEFTVETNDAIVILNGTATASDQIARAVAIAKSVNGVKSVTNVLAVKTS